MGALKAEIRVLQQENARLKQEKEAVKQQWFNVPTGLVVRWMAWC